MASANCRVAVMDVRGSYLIGGVTFFNNRFNRSTLSMIRGFNGWIWVPVPFGIVAGRFLSIPECRELGDIIRRLSDLC